MLASRRLRNLAVNANPLRRRIDRWESRVRVALVVAFVIAGPLVTWQAGDAAFHSTMRSASEMRQDRYPVDAVMVADAVDGDQPVDAATQPGDGAVRARWTGPDGSEHSETVAPRRAARQVGEVVRIWTDVHGNPVPAPASHSKAVGNGIGVGLFTALGMAALFLVLFVVSARAFERRRLRRWDRDWLQIEPHWSGRP